MWAASVETRQVDPAQIGVRPDKAITINFIAKSSFVTISRVYASAGLENPPKTEIVCALGVEIEMGRAKKGPKFAVVKKMITSKAIKT